MCSGSNKFKQTTIAARGTTKFNGIRPKDVKRDGGPDEICNYGSCPECELHKDEPAAYGCKYCCTPGGAPAGGGSAQLNSDVHVMVITLLIFAIIQARLLANFYH